MQISSKHFDFIWGRGKDNREDYHSKSHQFQHYIEKRSEHVTYMPLPRQ